MGRVVVVVGCAVVGGAVVGGSSVVEEAEGDGWVVGAAVVDDALVGAAVEPGADVEVVLRFTRVVVVLSTGVWLDPCRDAPDPSLSSLPIPPDERSAVPLSTASKP